MRCVSSFVCAIYKPFGFSGDIDDHMIKLVQGRKILLYEALMVHQSEFRAHARCLEHLFEQDCMVLAIAIFCSWRFRMVCWVCERGGQIRWLCRPDWSERNGSTPRSLHRRSDIRLSVFCPPQEARRRARGGRQFPRDNWWPAPASVQTHP